MLQALHRRAADAAAAGAEPVRPPPAPGAPWRRESGDTNRAPTNNGSCWVRSGAAPGRAPRPRQKPARRRWWATGSTARQIGRAHVGTPVTNAHVVRWLLLAKKTKNS